MGLVRCLVPFCAWPHSRRGQSPLLEPCGRANGWPCTGHPYPMFVAGVVLVVEAAQQPVDRIVQSTACTLHENASIRSRTLDATGTVPLGRFPPRLSPHLSGWGLLATGCAESHRRVLKRVLCLLCAAQADRFVHGHGTCMCCTRHAYIATSGHVMQARSLHFQHTQDFPVYGIQHVFVVTAGKQWVLCWLSWLPLCLYIRGGIGGCCHSCC